MDNNSILRIIISLLTGMFFSTTLLVSGTDAADPPCITRRCQWVVAMSSLNASVGVR